MDKNNNNNKINMEPQIEEMDQDFLTELNDLSKQLKTDDEIIKEFKSKKSKENKDNDKINTKNKNKSESNINNNNNTINNKLNDINELFQNNNENPFNEAYNIMNSKENNFNLEESDLMLDTLNIFNTKINQFNSYLNKSIGVNNKDDTNDKNINKNEINEKESNVLCEILDFLLQSNLLKDTILNMKKSIKESFEKNKNNLKNDENEKYKEALLNADNIINEANKIHPDKNKIMDSLQQLQQISTDVESMLFI